jgi:hypothetical protein
VHAFAAQVAVLEREREEVLQVAGILARLRRARGKQQHWDAVCDVLDSAVAAAETEMHRLGFAFAVAVTRE